MRHPTDNGYGASAWRRVTMAAGAAALLGGLAAASPADAADPGLTDTTIKIGVFGPLTGPSTLFGYPINNGAIAVYNEVNEAGGIHGRKIQIVHEDDACQPDRSVAAVKKLINRDEVFLLHGGSCDGSTLAARDIAIEAGVPFVVMAATSPLLVDKHVFIVAMAGVMQANTLMNYIKTMPEPRRVAVVHHPDAWGHERADPVIAGLRANGIEPVAVEVMDRNMMDATAQVQRLQRAGANIAALLLYPGEAAVFLRDAQRYGYKPLTFGTGGAMDLHDLAKRAGSYEAIEKFRVVSYLKGGVGSKEMEAPEATFRKSFPNTDPLALTFIGVGGARVVVEALERAGRDLTREKFLAAMETLKDFDNGANFCLFTYGPDDHIGCEDGTTWRIRNGEIVSLDPQWKPEHDLD